MSWTKGAETAKSVDDLMTSQSIEGRGFPDLEMLVAKVASVSRRIISNQYFRRRVSVEKQRAQKNDRFLRGRQIVNMIYDHFQATGAHDAAQGLSDLIQCFLTRRRHSGFRYKMGPISITCKRSS